MAKTDKNIINTRYIDVLDGIRAISVILVLIFHFWQQTWIFPVIKTPFLHFIKLDQINFTNLARAGYLLVDMMVLLSGFLLFLPVMRQIFLGEDMVSWKDYAKKRIARIVPSYYFAVLLIFFVIALPTHSYPTIAAAIKDLVTHLTFTHTLFVDTYLATKLDVVLWTVAVEVWFYVLFPFFAEAVKRRDRGDAKKSVGISVVSIIALALVFHGISNWWMQAKVMKQGVYVAMQINQLPAFMGCYANGMIGAMLYVLIAKNCERSKGLAAVCTLLSIVSIAYIVHMFNECAALPLESSQIWQVTERFRLTAAYMIFVLSTVLAARWYRFIFSNPLMRFLSMISYNLYIWHQWLAVDIKYGWRVPYWEGEIPPNQYWDKSWMTRYAIVITVAAFAAAILATFLIEKPFANMILGKPIFGRKKRGKTEMSENK